jgi:hypothetical protein
MDMRNVFWLGAALFLSTPVMAQSVEVGTGDWSAIPLLGKQSTVGMGMAATNKIDQIVANGGCDAIGRNRTINLHMAFLVEYTPSGNAKRIIVQRIGCPDVEQIAAASALYAVEKGIVRATGENEAGWYRGAISYVLR